MTMWTLNSREEVLQLKFSEMLSETCFVCNPLRSILMFQSKVAYWIKRGADSFMTDDSTLCRAHSR